jgi:predicted permease
MPALIFTVVAETPLNYRWGSELAIQAIIVAAAAALFILGVYLTHPSNITKNDLVVGATAAGYVNSNNMGMPIAIFVLGNARAVVPVLLLNLLILAPITLLLLDAFTSDRVSAKLILLQPIRNPIILASFAGAIVSGFGLTVPDSIGEPLSSLGGAAIPLMLMAFGMSLVGARPMQAHKSPRRAIVVASVVKSFAMPIMAFVLARFVFGLDQHGILTAVVIASLPTAQNVYNYAARYGVSERLARDTILLTTAFSPVILIWAAALLG